uniref:COBRA C-terminal domain-containing protein n=1 Tax=Kalanchoe fedtschenkoi TaxID=63787 RepID=A0A7N0T758_KALFE
MAAFNFNAVLPPSTLLLLLLAIAVAAPPFSLSQTLAPAPAADPCNGIFLTYTHTLSTRIPPDLTRSDPANQPYRFQSTLTILNNGLEDLLSWMVFVGFRHRELLVSASNAVLTDGTTLPAQVGNGTTFSGFPTADLKTAVETAGDVTQMQVQVELVGTQFGVKPPAVPMPTNISLQNDGFICPAPTMQGKSQMYVCCTKDPKFKGNDTLEDGFTARKSGDLTIMYDVTRTYDSSYWAQVTIANHNPLGRLDNWELSWDWMKDEFIFGMRGAYPDVVDTNECIFGKQGQFYKDFDFSTALNCQRRPTIVDLPLDKTNDSTLGFVPFCCRNGTILPPQMDPSKSSSAFLINVYKMPPDNNRSQLTPPQNWGIKGRLNPDYKCGPPVRVSPTLFPHPSGQLADTSAVASWQVVCNITQAKAVSPKCCVSFSAYYNESVVPCNTCACGCSSRTSNTCSSTAPAVLLPPEALLLPFENRTAKALAWAALKHRTVPNPMPCGDNCGVSLNWHVLSDYTKGWSARITLFNWEDESYADWFAAVEMDKAALGFEKVYSFNGTMLPDHNNTIFMQGLKDFEYLVAEVDGANPAKDPRVPGKQQSVLSFTKKQTPGINVPLGDGFPTKVFFNGEECSLPTYLPISDARRNSLAVMVLLFFTFMVMVLMQL